MATQIVRPKPVCRGFGLISRCFTLIELLVVIAIIAILIGLLLPALSQAVVMATVAKCLANQHQMGIGMAAYESDNNGALPGIQAQEGGSVRVNGELGVQYGQPPYQAAEAYGLYYGWRQGAMIYATFEKSTGSGNTMTTLYPYTTAEAGPWGYSLEVEDGVTGWDSPNPSANGSTIYSAPVGLGYVGQYLSPYGTADATDGRIFYCPGTPASFDKPGYYTDPQFDGPGYAGCLSILERRSNQGADGLYSTFLSDWNKGVGQGGGSLAGAPEFGGWMAAYDPMGTVYGRYQTHSVNPFVYSTYIYRSGCYYDYIDSNYHVHTDLPITMPYATTPGDSVWRSQDTQYPKSDAPFLNGECFMVCNSVYLENVQGTYGQGREVFLADLCHTGKMVNRAFHDGSASSWAVPLGHFAPGDETVGAIYYGCTDAPPGAGQWTQWSEGVSVYQPPSPYTYGGGLMSRGASIWPYYWAVLDGKAPIPTPAGGW